jgi:hypothetical protein
VHVRGGLSHDALARFREHLGAPRCNQSTSVAQAHHVVTSVRCRTECRGGQGTYRARALVRLVVRLAVAGKCELRQRHREPENLEQIAVGDLAVAVHVEDRERNCSAQGRGRRDGPAQQRNHAATARSRSNYGDKEAASKQSSLQ